MPRNYVFAKGVGCIAAAVGKAESGDGVLIKGNAFGKNSPPPEWAEKAGG